MLSPQWGQEYQTSPRKQGPGMRAFANTWCLTVVESGTSVDVHLLGKELDALSHGPLVELSLLI